MTNQEAIKAIKSEITYTEEVKLEALKKAMYALKDSKNTIEVWFKLDDENEILQRYIESFGNNDHSLTPARINGNMAYGVGIPFESYVNLANQKFTVKIESSVNSSVPYLVYMLFHGIIEL